MGQSHSSELGRDSLREDNHRHLMEVQRMLTSNEVVSSIILPNFSVDDEGVDQAATALCSNCSVLIMDLSYNNLTGKCMNSLCGALARSSLISLSLAGNRVGEDGCRALATYLRRSPPLEELSLYNNGLVDNDIVPLCNALLRNQRLAVVRLDMNDLTNASCIMIHTVMKHNKSLTVVSLSSEEAMDPVLLREVKVQLGANKIVFDHRKEQERAEVIASAKSRVAAEAVEKQRRVHAEAEAQQQATEAAAALEVRRKEEMEIEEFEANLKKHKMSHKPGNASLAADQMKQVVSQAYEWRQRLTGNGTLVKEWRDGFTMMATLPGDSVGTMPSVTAEAPRRLRACWCDPHDISAPFAKTLHYHCKHEDLNRQVDEGDIPKYDGCRASGHVCATVGFYAKPLPDLSAAHFFASKHPSNE